MCAQAGEVNTGAFDPLEEIAAACSAAEVWLHVDGAFGLWAAASPTLAHLTTERWEALLRDIETRQVPAFVSLLAANAGSISTVLSTSITLMFG